MRIGNGPRLVVPRPGNPGRRGWYGHYRDRGQAYDEWREQRRTQLRAMSKLKAVAGDRKREAWTLHGALFLAKNYPKDTTYWRRVDDHGRSYGPRIIASNDLPAGTRLRLALRQPEDLHSQLSRMLKRAHKDAMRTE